MFIKEFLYKSKAYMHRKIFQAHRDRKWYNGLYRSYWHMKKHKQSREEANNDQFLAARPNPGAGIGHQISNWLAGYEIAQYYSLQYSAFPFSHLDAPFVPDEWDVFLGLNDGIFSPKQLIKNKYKKVLLPLFDFDKESDRILIANIIKSYTGKRVFFLLEQDQFVKDELGSLEYMRSKYYASPARKNDKLTYSLENFNIAVHIRRGDIVQTGTHKNSNLTMRWLDIDYYIRKLEEYLPIYCEGKIPHIYLFSQAERDELAGFERFGIIHFCNDMSARDSFLHMVNADMLIMSKSGMSYQAAKLNTNGIIIYPKGFWIGAVNSEKWIIADA